MDITTLNKVLAGKKIVSVEQGGTHNWFLVNFDAAEFQLYDREGNAVATEPGTRLYLTVHLEGQYPDDEHYAPCALHTTKPDGGGTLQFIRDERDPATLWPSVGTKPWWEQKK